MTALYSVAKSFEFLNTNNSQIYENEVGSEREELLFNDKTQMNYYMLHVNNP